MGSILLRRTDAPSSFWFHCFIELKKSIAEVRSINERIISSRIDAKTKNVNLIYVYISISTSKESEIMKVYAQIQKIFDIVPTRERLIVMGDFNAKIGVGTDPPACGLFILGVQNKGD